jgi:putative transposase
VLLENYYLPGDLKARIGEFIAYYNTERYHESLNNLPPEDMYTGRGQTVLNRRRKIKQETIADNQTVRDRSGR